MQNTKYCSVFKIHNLNKAYLYLKFLYFKYSPTLTVLGKLLFKNYLLHHLLLPCKSIFLLYLLIKFKSSMLQLQLLFKSNKITYLLHSLLAA